MELFKGEYFHVLNSEDSFDPALGLVQNKTRGGTMILWKKSLSQFVTMLPVTSPSFLPVLLQLPGAPTSVHISLYLPTSGRESEFIEEVTKLKLFIEEVLESSIADLIFIRGDSNVNPNHHSRVTMLNDLLNSFNMVRIPLRHQTYHHFMGDGNYDSEIDVIIQTKIENSVEEVKKIYCKHDYPQIESHHDVIISSVLLPVKPVTSEITTSSVPIIENTRERVVWSQDSLSLYQNLLRETLPNLRARWMKPGSKTSVSILLETTASVLSSAAASTNKSLSLAKSPKIRSVKMPKKIRNSNKHLMKLKRIIVELSNHDPGGAAIAKSELKAEKSKLKGLVRCHQNNENIVRDAEVFTILSTNASSLYSKIRSKRATHNELIPFLKVGEKEFTGDSVKEGFYHSINNLKTSKDPQSDMDSAWAGIDIFEDYQNILDICSSKRDLPPISIEDSSKVLLSMKATVRDFFQCW